MENHVNSIKSLFKETGDYLEVRLDLIKLKVVDKSSSVLSSLVSILVIILVAFLFFLVLNMGVAFWLGHLLGKWHYGFFIVAGFYVVLGLILYFFKDKFFKTPISNMIIKKFLN